MARRVIGLTGGIATGKSTVGRLLAGRGIPVIDADLLAREAVAPGGTALAAIVHRYGSAMLTDAGALNRSALARIVFSDPDERRWLESRIHPFVRAAMQAAIERTAGTICLMIPLLFEAGMTDLVTEIWVVSCEPEQQHARLKKRDGPSDEAIAARIASQWPLAEKVRLADVVIDNNGEPAHLERQVACALAQASI
ncbi:MAG: dephospho-CoA kinase [Aphanocapsa lilacina HA4352-LM1]|jgi:dephospho-CoA kinase|nr:dephospho-CoA kinase [Aphanocapsa lilacina HA4352-LM1]